MKFSALIISLFSFFIMGSTALAAPSVKSESTQIAGDFKKNIFKGNKEVNLTGSLGHNEFTGVYTDIDLSYRYFLADKLSLGPILGGYYSDHFRSIDLGVSGRWYFFEVGNWAYSLTQNFVYSSFRQNIPGVTLNTGALVNGQTQLSSNYFFTPEVYLGISLEYDYTVSRSRSVYGIDNELTSRIGFGLTF